MEANVYDKNYIDSIYILDLDDVNNGWRLVDLKAPEKRACFAVITRANYIHIPSIILFAHISRL